MGGVQVDRELFTQLGLDDLDLLHEGHDDIAEVGGGIVGESCVAEGHQLQALEQGDEAPDNAGGCKVGR